MRHFDFGNLANNIEKLSPKLARLVSMKVLSLASPFNAHLKGRLIKWDRKVAEIEVHCHRGVKNHLGGIHAGALFTLGETCAGLLIVREFSFKTFRLIMTDIQASFTKQALGTVRGRCHADTATMAKIKKALAQDKPQKLNLVTEIRDKERHVIASVETSWQIKPWESVRGPANK